jgi:hypothetical protein
VNPFIHSFIDKQQTLLFYIGHVVEVVPYHYYYAYNPLLYYYSYYLKITHHLLFHVMLVRAN